MIIRLILGYAGIVIGFSAFIAFCVLRNYPSAVLAFLVGVINILVTFLHTLVRRRTIRDWYDPSDLRQISRFSYAIMFVGVFSLAYFSVLEYLTRKPIYPVSENFITNIVFGFILTKYCLTLLYYSWKYQYEEDPPLVVQVEAPAEEDERTEEATSSD